MLHPYLALSSNQSLAEDLQARLKNLEKDRVQVQRKEERNWGCYKFEKWSKDRDGCSSMQEGNRFKRENKGKSATTCTAELSLFQKISKPEETGQLNISGICFCLVWRRSGRSSFLSFQDNLASWGTEAVRSTNSFHADSQVFKPDQITKHDRTSKNNKTEFVR